MASNQDNEDSHVLILKMDDARIMATLLRTISFKDTALVFATSMGLKFTVENHKCFQANAFLQAGLFYEYTLKEQQVSFKISLSVLMDCLTIFGSESMSGKNFPSLKMCYDGYGEPLIMVLEESGVVTNCSISTMDADMTLNFDFISSNVSNKVIMKAQALKEAFGEMDGRSEVMEMMMSPSDPYFRITTFTEFGDNSTEFSEDSELFESFSCTNTRSYRYKVALLKPAMKALGSAQKVSVRTDKRGFLSLQVMIHADANQPSFVEFLCAPDEEYPDEDDG